VEIKRQVVVLDAADLVAESSFWAGVLGGQVDAGDDWHSVSDSDGTWRLGIQLAPNHVAPDWPDGTPEQQIHLDLWVDEPDRAHRDVMELGARLLQESVVTPTDGFRVYADPAGHPFCICWER
jgi:hypothetical protein